MDAGFEIALGFWGLGILWLIIAHFVLGIMAFLRKLIG